MAPTQNRESASRLRIRRRKRSLYTAVIPTGKRHPPRPSPSRRFVYVVARPLKKARNVNLASLSKRKFSLCHWGLLVSPYNPDELQQCIQHQLGNRTKEIAAWGTLFEIFDDRGTMRLNVMEHFGLRQNLIPEWGYACIMHFGKTRLKDNDITHHGTILSHAALI